MATQIALEHRLVLQTKKSIFSYTNSWGKHTLKNQHSNIVGQGLFFTNHGLIKQENPSKNLPN